MKNLKKFFNSKAALFIAVVVIAALSALTTLAVVELGNNNKALDNTISRNATEAQIKQAYLDILERPADNGGLAVYSRMPIDEVRADLMASKERKALELKKYPVTSQSNTEAQSKATISTKKVTSTSAASQPAKTTSTPTVVTTYVAPVCTETKIPYETTYTDDDTMYVGETFVGLTGRDGSIKTCTADSNGYKPADIRMAPFNAHVYVGTKSRTNNGTTLTYEQALSKAQNFCQTVAQGAGTGSSAYQQCISTVLADYGF